MSTAPQRSARPGAVSIARELYDSFQRGELARFDAIIADDVGIYSPVGYGLTGKETLKGWAAAFLDALQPRVDLLDEHDATVDGSGRAFVTVNLHWKHTRPFFELQPTGREGTSIETFLLTVRDGKIVRFDVADHSLDLVLYFAERGWQIPKNLRPAPLVTGVERR